MREWLVTNGLGGYTSLTHNMMNERKFHGLLIASLHPPVDRWVFVSNMYDVVEIQGKHYELSKIPARFSFEFLPKLTYEIAGKSITKTICMHHGYNTTLIRYDTTFQEPLHIQHYPYVSSRHFYHVLFQPEHLGFDIESFNHGVYLQPDNTNEIIKILLEKSEFFSNHHWKHIEYPLDRLRLDSFHDHVFSPGVLSSHILPNTPYYVMFTIEDEPQGPQEIFNDEIERRKKICTQSQFSKELHPLLLSADSFLVRKNNEKTILAGYPWFSDWGRDTLIALPGITLVSGKFQTAKDILFNLQRYQKQGLIPNTFDDLTNDPAYNTVDASLWYIDRVFQYLKYTNDWGFVDKVFPAMQSIIHAYQTKTINDIHMDEDYLIAHGPGLTWMDVKMGEFYPTPRASKAVEIQALWYNALRIMDICAERLDKQNPYQSLAASVKESFNAQYDQPYDVIDTKDVSCRPNALFLLSLDFCMVESKEIIHQIIENTEKKLLTVFGLRTLEQNNPQYKGSYIGDYPRDITYHNGTVWPWLLVSFITAYLKAKNHSNDARSYAFESFLYPLQHVYGKNWDGNIHEIFDGDPPFHPRGCIAQAWSVAEILRSWVEDINLCRPPYEKGFHLDEIRV